MRLRTCAALIALLAGAARGSETRHEVLGFSPDGKRAAVILHDDGDTSCIAWAELHLLEASAAEQPAPERREVHAGEKECGGPAAEEKAVQEARALAQKKAQELGFDSWRRGPASGATVEIKPGEECDEDFQQPKYLASLLVKGKEW